MPAFAHYQPDAGVEAYRRNTMDFAGNPFFYAGDYEVLRQACKTMIITAPHDAAVTGC